MTDQPETVAPAVDPNRHRRAVIRIDERMIHDLFQLPPDIEVRWIADDPLRLRIDVMVTSPDLPVVEEGAIPPDLNLAYAKIYERPVLVDTGISTVPGATQWEWGYRYLDWAAGSAAGPMPERTARIRGV